MVMIRILLSKKDSDLQLRDFSFSMTMDELVISYKQGDELEGLCFLHLNGMETPRGAITKRTGDWLEGLSQKLQNIFPKIAIFKKMLKSYPLNILKVQSESAKTGTLGQIFIFTENCTPNYPYESF